MRFLQEFLCKEISLAITLLQCYRWVIEDDLGYGRLGAVVVHDGRNRRQKHGHWGRNEGTGESEIDQVLETSDLSGDEVRQRMIEVDFPSTMNDEVRFTLYL